MKPDPILEECYRIKEEYSAQFKDVQAFFEHLKEIEAEEKRKGKKYAPPPQYLEFRVTAEHLEFVIGRAKKGAQGHANRRVAQTAQNWTDSLRRSKPRPCGTILG